VTDERQRHPGQPPVAAVGLILVVGGAVLLAGQLLDIDVGRIGWPLFVIIPGVVLLVAGLATAGGLGLTLAGSIVTMVGLVLFVQNATDLYATWAYAWALIGPFGSGLGMVLHGTVHRQPELVRGGWWPLITGIGLFIVGFIFFEGIIGLSGDRLDLPDWVLPVLLIGFGVVVLLWSLTGRRIPFDSDRYRG
jgi:hypothetical protein